MSAFTVLDSAHFEHSLSRARRRRADSGKSRLPDAVQRRLDQLLSTRDRPRVIDVLTDIGGLCRAEGLRPPSRATIYAAFERAEPPVYETGTLPEPVRRALYNLDGVRAVPGHQVAFCAFNYGDAQALSFAAGMPWLCLHHAARIRGWRPKSLALLKAVMHCRGL